MALALPPADGSTDVAPSRRPARPGVSAPRLTVVIVNFCQWQNTYRLVRQLRRSDAVRGGDADVVIVDNGSPAAPVVKRLQSLRGVRLQLNKENLGFAAAVNRGVAAGCGEWVLLLNPDVTVADGFLDDALTAVEKAARLDPATGVIGLQLLNADGTPQPSAGRFPTLPSTLAGLLRPRARRKCRLPGGARRPVEWVTGGCLLVRRDCFLALGGLDERFFLYYEDVDFCKRVRVAGRSVWYDPALAVTHHWPLHRRAVPAPLRFITRHALLTYADRHWPGWQRGVLRAVVRVEGRLRAAWATLRGDSVATACYRELAAAAARPSREDAGVAFAARFLRPIAAAQDARPAAA